MQIQNKPEIVSAIVTRTINTVPVSEIIRVYSQLLQQTVEALSDEDLVNALEENGFFDLIEQNVTYEEE